MIDQKPLIKPSTIAKNLILESKKPESAIEVEWLPQMTQIQRLKYSHLNKHNNLSQEREEVGKLIEQRQYKPTICPNDGFVFAAKNGIGSDADPLLICITALNWLTWIKK